YRDLLHREADPSGLATFSTILNNGWANRVQVALGIQASSEFQTSAVQARYVAFLHRAADASGLATYSALLAGGGTIGRVDAILAGSDEYFQTRAGGNNDGF